MASLSLGSLSGCDDGMAPPGSAVQVTITPSVDTINALFDTIQFSVAAVDQNGTPVSRGDIRWASLDPDYVAVTSPFSAFSRQPTATGSVVLNRPHGTARLEASAGSVADTAHVVVRQVMAGLRIEPATAAVQLGGRKQIFGIASDSNGYKVRFIQYQWESSAPEVLAVHAYDGIGNDVGQVRALATGEARLTVRFGGAAASAQVIVPRPAPIQLDSIHTGPFNHHCGLTADGSAYCWGDNGYGALGTADWPESEPLPAPVAGTLHFRQLALGFRHTCGVTAGHVAYCWGENTFGELGASTSALCAGLPCSRTPVPVATGLEFRSIATGRGHTCGIATDDRAYCWGDNERRQLGAGTDAGQSSTPLAVRGNRAFRAIAAGQEYSCGITVDRRLYCWGGYAFGSEPKLLLGETEFASLSGGNYHGCALSTAGAAYCWGSNQAGQLGNGSTSGAGPVAVAGGHTFASLSAGGLKHGSNSASHTCAITAEGRAYCWGDNRFGQLGIGVRRGNCIGYFCEVAPAEVAGDIRFRAISAGSASTCGIAVDEAIYCWGYADYLGLDPAAIDVCHESPAAPGVPCVLQPTPLAGARSNAGDLPISGMAAPALDRP